MLCMYTGCIKGNILQAHDQSHLHCYTYSGMSKAMTFAAYLCVSVALVSAGEFSAEWNEWKTLHGKIYESEREELTRYATWVANKAYIEEHNKHSDVHGFTLKMNQFGDLVQCYNYVCVLSC